jgi:hypothetical protein
MGRQHEGGHYIPDRWRQGANVGGLKPSHEFIVGFRKRKLKFPHFRDIRGEAIVEGSVHGTDLVKGGAKSFCSCHWRFSSADQTNRGTANDELLRCQAPHTARHIRYQSEAAKGKSAGRLAWMRSLRSWIGGRAGMMDTWPDIPFKPWKETCATLHLWLQIVGKYRLRRTPWINHGWHVTRDGVPDLFPYVGIAQCVFHVVTEAVEFHAVARDIDRLPKAFEVLREPLRS